MAVVGLGPCVSGNGAYRAYLHTGHTVYPKNISILVGGLEPWNFIFSIQLGISSSFFRGVGQPPSSIFIGKIMMDHGGFSCVSPLFFALFLHPLRHHQSPASSTSGQFYVSDMMWYALRYSKVGGFDMLWHISWHVLTCWLVFHAHGMEFVWGTNDTNVARPNNNRP